MKRLFAFIALLPVSGLYAQPVMEAADLAPVIGENFIARNGSLNNPGSAGANVTWDLSAMTTGNPIYVGYTDADASFPGSTITAEFTGGSVYHYVDYAANGLFVYGTNSGGTITDFDDPMRKMIFPLEMGASNTDYFHGIYENGGVVYEHFGTQFMEVDGYGTLITPEGTFNNVLRVHSVCTYQDSTDESTETNIVTESYSWYMSGFHYELANINIMTIADVNMQFISAFYTETGSLGIAENDKQPLTITPNPATDRISITIDPSLALETVEITDLNGHAFNATYQAETKQVKVDLSTISAGVYFVTVRYSSGLVQQGRFIRQ